MSDIKTIDDFIEYVEDRLTYTYSMQESNRDTTSKIYNQYAGYTLAFRESLQIATQIKVNMDKKEICTCRRPISEYKHKYTCKCGQKWVKANRKDIQAIFFAKEKQND